jgi:predicted alpha/beta-hydrolase family hydrolase
MFTPFVDLAAKPGIRGFLHEPEQPGGDVVVLSHGAGADCQSKLLVEMSEALAAAGFTVLRLDLPFRQLRPHGPPPPGSAARDQDGLRRAVEAMTEKRKSRRDAGATEIDKAVMKEDGGVNPLLHRQAGTLGTKIRIYTEGHRGTEGTEKRKSRRDAGGTKIEKAVTEEDDGVNPPLHEEETGAGRIFLGGHSYGGRQATLLVAEEPGLVDGLLLLSYPLHPPKKPAELRTRHFPKLSRPAFFVHGTRDGFGSIAEMKAALELIPGPHALFEIDGAGHDLLGKKTGGELPGRIVKEFQAFMRGK